VNAAPAGAPTLEQVYAQNRMLRLAIDVCLSNPEHPEMGLDTLRRAIAVPPDEALAMYDRGVIARAARYPDVRLVRLNTPLLGMVAARDEDCSRLTAEWNEPDDLGVYDITVTRHTDDNPLRDAKAELESYRQALVDILAKQWNHSHAMRNVARAVLAKYPR